MKRSITVEQGVVVTIALLAFVVIIVNVITH